MCQLYRRRSIYRLTSPILFNLYVNELIEELSSARVGCQIGGVSVNNLSYADDMALLSPSVCGLRSLINICEKYAENHGLLYNVAKTEVMIFKYKKGPENVLPIKLCGSELRYVTKFKYLGHVLSDTMKDNEDLERQRRSLAAKSNMLARRFTRCSRQVKVTLFKAYCQALYTSQLWYTYSKATFDALRVQYNNAFRALLGLPWRCSASDGRIFAPSVHSAVVTVAGAKRMKTLAVARLGAIKAWSDMISVYNEPGCDPDSCVLCICARPSGLGVNDRPGVVDTGDNYCPSDIYLRLASRLTPALRPTSCLP
ncbi:uncharacterized protein LOC123872451 [Maniola jurtina]|uniref:uncharacterized protein LOC123872451 n=1 Tax=Maniola jurtina TaxID=191418 RepID=UPI001E68954C|nr:uncharacterized protein LOC123872451 [Maniola jurtina]